MASPSEAYKGSHLYRRLSKYQLSKGQRKANNFPRQSPGHITTLPGYKKTPVCAKPYDGNYKVFAIDCEMVHTTDGSELGRITIINEDLQVVYDEIVKPDNDITDYRTSVSGLTKGSFSGVTVRLGDVQKDVLGMINSNTILIGHSLDSDLHAMKIFHTTVVDTSIVFREAGTREKASLRDLTSAFLNRSIQEAEGGQGHDSREDAVACFELMLWRLKHDM